jgi:hypothetical protein
MTKEEPRVRLVVLGGAPVCEGDVCSVPAASAESTVELVGGLLAAPRETADERADREHDQGVA